ncbi:MAG: hypothetical protein E7069_04980 [Bacteroidales bacterium]|nr:hypothetical protein [Bacteroidales bacterium]
MIKKNILLLAFLGVAAVSASAQGYTRLQLNFAPQTMEIKDVPSEYANNDFEVGWDGMKLSTPGFGLGFIKGIELSKTKPLFLELGANANFLFKKADYSEGEDYKLTTKYSFLNLAIPVNLAYRIKVSDAFSIQPFAGLNLKFNLLGKCKNEFEEDSYSFESEADFFSDKYSEGEFSDGDSYFGGDKAKRFQLGLNVGCGFNISKLYIGYTFQPDLTNYAEIKADETYKVKTRSNVITIGLNF